MKLKDDYYLIVPFLLGGVLVRANQDFILESTFIKGKSLRSCALPRSSQRAEIPLLKEAKKQLFHYFEGKSRDLSLPLDPGLGTPFQRSVWLALQGIPYGETCSYKDIAVAINNPKGSRAVGMANNKNPFVLFAPCHRVVQKNGELGGFGAGCRLKKWLLNLEGVKI